MAGGGEVGRGRGGNEAAVGGADSFLPLPGHNPPLLHLPPFIPPRLSSLSADRRCLPAAPPLGSSIRPRAAPEAALPAPSAGCAPPPLSLCLALSNLLKGRSQNTTWRPLRPALARRPPHRARLPVSAARARCCHLQSAQSQCFGHRSTVINSDKTLLQKQ